VGDGVTGVEVSVRVGAGVSVDVGVGWGEGRPVGTGVSVVVGSGGDVFAGGTVAWTEGVRSRSVEDVGTGDVSMGGALVGGITGEGGDAQPAASSRLSSSAATI
jgi:hypothetical protein